MSEAQEKRKLFKITVAVILIGVLAGAYFTVMAPDDMADCTAGCEKPGAGASLPCNSSMDCEVRGKDEWETCQNKKEPFTETHKSMPSKDQTSKTQEGYSCVCMQQQCQYHKP